MNDDGVIKDQNGNTWGIEQTNPKDYLVEIQDNREEIKELFRAKASTLNLYWTSLPKEIHEAAAEMMTEAYYMGKEGQKGELLLKCDYCHN